MNWALIVDGQVREITDIDPAGRFHSSLHWQECGEATRPGDVWTGDAFAPPPASDVPLRRVVSPLAFRGRFTDDELGAITLAASRALDGGKPQLEVWIADLGAAGEVDLDGERLARGLDLLVSVGLLTKARRAEILA